MKTDTNSTNSIFSYLYTWKAPERQWTPKDRSWYVIYSFFFVTLIAVLAILGEYLLILTVLAFVFLWFVQGSIEPPIMEHTITSIGIKTLSKLYRWDNIKCFWFAKKEGVITLNFDLIDPENPASDFNSRFSLLTTSEDEVRKIFNILLNYINYGERDEIKFNFLTQLIYGEYIDISFFLPPSEEAEKVADKKPRKKKSVEKVELPEIK